MREKTKKYLVLFLMLALIMICFAFAGCSAESENTGDAEQAQETVDYPTKPIRIIVPYKAGGNSDLNARKIAEIIAKEKLLDQEVLVVNIEGSNTVEGIETVVNAEPDGYTLLLTQTAWLSQANMGTVPYTYNDVIPVCQVLESPVLVVANKDTPYNSMEELTQYINDHPGEVRIGIGGYANSGHLGGQTYFDNTGTLDKIKLVVYQGGADSLSAQLAGEHDVRFSTASDAMRYVTSGDLKCLATTSVNRPDAIADTPTFGELGYDLTFSILQGLYAPLGTPQEVVDIISEAVGKACATDDYIKYINDNAASVESSYADSAAFKANLDNADEIIKGLVKNLTGK